MVWAAVEIGLFDDELIAPHAMRRHTFLVIENQVVVLDTIGPGSTSHPLRDFVDALAHEPVRLATARLAHTGEAFLGPLPSLRRPR